MKPVDPIPRATPLARDTTLPHRTIRSTPARHRSAEATPPTRTALQAPSPDPFEIDGKTLQSISTQSTPEDFNQATLEVGVIRPRASPEFRATQDSEPPYQNSTELSNSC